MKSLPFLLALLTAGTSFGQTPPPTAVAYTLPSGYVKFDLVVGFNPIGINLHGVVLTSGTIDSESSNIITDADVDFTTILTDALATYTIEITSGTQNGAVAEIQDFDANTLTLEAGIGAGTATYSIRKAKTLNEIFGTGDDLQLQGGFTSVGADIVWVPDPENPGQYKEYFHRTNSNEFRLTSTPGASPPKPISVFYPDGLFVQVASTPKSVTLFGEVKTSPTIAAAAPGFNLVTIPSPVGQTLNESGLDAFLTGGTTSVGADIVWIPDAGSPGNYTQYFYRTLSSEWRLTSSPGGDDQGGVVLPASVFIQRAGATGTAGRITPPAFFSSL